MFGRELTLETFGNDNYGRTLANVLLPDGTHINHTLVKDRWCWWYRKYAPGNNELEQLEKDAQKAMKGLWVNPAPIPPWVLKLSGGSTPSKIVPGDQLASSAKTR